MGQVWQRCPAPARIDAPVHTEIPPAPTICWASCTHTHIHTYTHTHTHTYTYTYTHTGRHLPAMRINWCNLLPSASFGIGSSIFDPAAGREGLHRRRHHHHHQNTNRPFLFKSAPINLKLFAYSPSLDWKHFNNSLKSLQSASPHWMITNSGPERPVEPLTKVAIVEKLQWYKFQSRIKEVWGGEGEELKQKNGQTYQKDNYAWSSFVLFFFQLTARRHCSKRRRNPTLQKAKKKKGNQKQKKTSNKIDKVGVLLLLLLLTGRSNCVTREQRKTQIPEVLTASWSAMMRDTVDGDGVGRTSLRRRYHETHFPFAPPRAKSTPSLVHVSHPFHLEFLFIELAAAVGFNQSLNPVSRPIFTGGLREFNPRWYLHWMVADVATLLQGRIQTGADSRWTRRGAASTV